MSTAMTALQTAMSDCGLIAILRGIHAEEAADIGRELYNSGFRIVEVPLNSPDPFDSIRVLRESLPADCLVGAGTVIKPSDCAAIAAAGGQLVVMPHSDAKVIGAAKEVGLICVPGVATLTEAYAALAAGADGLKMFPAEQLGAAVLKAWRAVLRPPIALLPVGGIEAGNIASYAAAGATGFGLGSALYQSGLSAAAVATRAKAFMAAWRAAYPATGRQ